MNGESKKPEGRRKKGPASAIAIPLIRWVSALVLLSVPPSPRAHIGSPIVFYEGQAGPYPMRVVVRPPDVIPGLAEISIRVGTNGVREVSVLPVRWNTGREGAPSPDRAALVRGETNLYNSQLWFMQGGAQSVEVEVRGALGPGRVIVPVNAVATAVLRMPRGLGGMLACFGSVLFLLLVAVIGAAVRDSVLPPGEVPTSRRRWAAHGARLGAIVLLGGAAFLGKRWWDSEASNYRHNRLYQPLQTAATLNSVGAERMLHLEIVDERFQRGAPLVPDHGKLMHLFLVREPGLDAFAHLHPRKLDWKTFESPLPALPAGRYTLYADVTTETGFSETLTASLTLSDPISVGQTGHSSQADPDDAWCQAQPLAAASAPGSERRPILTSFADGAVVNWIAGSGLSANRETTLSFSIRDRAGRPLHLQPYLGMTGHLVLRRDDGSVFTHIHPGGSFSMAAQQLFELRAEGKAPLKAAPATNDPICRLPSAEELAAAWSRDRTPSSDTLISFPYAFPKAGAYRLWMQFKTGGEIRTAVFDAQVQPSGGSGT